MFDKEKNLADPISHILLEVDVEGVRFVVAIRKRAHVTCVFHRRSRTFSPGESVLRAGKALSLELTVRWSDDIRGEDLRSNIENSMTMSANGSPTSRASWMTTKNRCKTSMLTSIYVDEYPVSGPISPRARATYARTHVNDRLVLDLCAPMNRLHAYNEGHARESSKSMATEHRSHELNLSREFQRNLRFVFHFAMDFLQLFKIVQCLSQFGVLDVRLPSDL